MENLIDKIKKERKLNLNDDYLKKLSEAGFPKKTNGYPIITLEAIKEYLKNEFIIRNKIKEDKIKKVYFCEHSMTVSYSSDWSSYIDLRWQEKDIIDFKSTPPIHILDSIIEAKKHFDFIKIVTIQEVKDPLVVGINKGDSNRYLIDWWENDIKPEELVG